MHARGRTRADLVGADDKVDAVHGAGERRVGVGTATFEVQVVIPPGQSGDLVFRLTEPTSPGAPRVPVQPLIDAVNPRVSVPECAA